MCKLITRSHNIAIVCVALAISMCVASCAQSDAGRNDQDRTGGKANGTPSQPIAQAKEYEGLHNVVTYSDGFLIGAQPEGDEAFDTLESLNVKTIISVDGAIPEVDLAQAHGIRYIHLPIGYDGVDEDRKVELARATRDAMKEGDVYLHCHHGKHRCAAAAGSVLVALDLATPEEAVEYMKVSGTSPHYKGLYYSVEKSRRIDQSELDAIDGNFPAEARPTSFISAMINISTAFEHLREIKLVGWDAPPDHPDLVPSAVAASIAEAYRALRESDESAAYGAGFLDLMNENYIDAQRLEYAIVAQAPKHDLTTLFDRMAASCKSCHAEYRD